MCILKIKIVWLLKAWKCEYENKRFFNPRSFFSFLSFLAEFLNYLNNARFFSDTFWVFTLRLARIILPILIRLWARELPMTSISTHPIRRQTRFHQPVIAACWSGFDAGHWDVCGATVAVMCCCADRACPVLRWHSSYWLVIGYRMPFPPRLGSCSVAGSRPAWSWCAP